MLDQLLLVKIIHIQVRIPQISITNPIEWQHPQNLSLQISKHNTVKTK
jgi:hypothetical protein